MKYKLDRFGGWTPARVVGPTFAIRYTGLLPCDCSANQLPVVFYDGWAYTIACHDCYSGPPDFVATQPTLWDATEEWNEHIEEGRA